VSVIDGYRFLLYFFDTIQMSVAHLYHSALPFAPKTPLWDTYRARETSVEARILQGCEQEWTSLVRTVSLPSGGREVRYSHDGRMLAAGGDDFSHLFWSGTGERLAELKPSYGKVSSISFSCDDRTLATTSNNVVHLWDVASGSLIRTLVGDSADLEGADFHPYIGHLLVASDECGRVYVWDVRDSTHTDFNVAGNIGILCWVPGPQREKKRIIIGCKDGGMEMWDIDTLQRVQVFSSYGEIHMVVSSDDGSLVASFSHGGMLLVYSTHTGKVVYSYEDGGRIFSVVFSPTAPILAFASEFEVFLWFYTTDYIVIFPDHTHFVFSIAFSPNGRFIASASQDDTLRIWETSATTPAPDNIHHLDNINNVHFSNDGQLIVSASRDSRLKVWDTLTGTLCTTLEEHTSMVWETVILPDNVHVVSRDATTLMVWDWQKGKILFTDTAIASDHGDFVTLHPYTHALSPLGFISTHAISYESEERIVCCWTVDLSVPGNTRVVLVAHGVVNTLESNILRIMHRASTETPNPTLVLECSSGKQFSALWDGPHAIGNSPVQLQFVEEPEESSLKDTWQSLAGPELPCHQSDDRAWILNKHDQQILWIPPANRGYRACWHGHRLVIGGSTGRLTLVDFSDVILNNNIEF
jgi:WD40 repeat protein